MKKFRFILVVAVIVLSGMTIFVRYSFAQNMISPSGYEIIDPTISAGGNDDQTSTSSTYLLRESIGVSFMDERFESANYKLEVGTGYTFEANTPSISYFSATDGTMENICGHGGCYDRARFEIDNKTRLFDSNTAGLWRLDEQAGSGAYLLDISGNNNHGTPTGTSYTYGKIGGAREFIYNPGTNYVSVPDHTSLNFGTESFSVSYWLNFNTGVTQQRWSLGKGTPYLATGPGWAIAHWSTGDPITPYLYFSDGVSVTTASFGSMNRGTWYHLTFVCDRSANLIKTYRDGQFVIQTDITGYGSITNTDSLLIGTGNGTGNVGDCLVDEVNISNTAHTIEEIQMDYNFGLGVQDNPYDTLYLIEISDDDWATVQYVDGPTHTISSSKDINDYLTESSWETGAWSDENILGLTPGTEYKIRARALNGDFSESEAGPALTASTTVPQTYLDLNIAGGTWSSTSAPYTIDLGDVSKTSVTTASDYIWIDMGTNALSGSTISVRDTNNGLYSATIGETIASQSEDLNTQSEGYGLKIDTTKRLPASGQPGFLRESTTYNTAGGDEVGAISTSPTVIFCSIVETGGNCSTGTGTPLHEGRAAIWIKARAAFTRGSAADYTDTITFSATGTF